MVNRRWILIAAVVAGTISCVSAIADEAEFAIAALALGMLASLAWVVLWARALNSAVARVSTSVAGLATAADLGELRHEVRTALVTVQRTPSVTVELQRLYDRLVAHDRPMPELGDWAMTASTLVWITDQIAAGRVTTILECGSGSSTVWFASAFERRGGDGRIVSLESSAEYAAETRQRLSELGLGHRAEVLHAPLVPTSLESRAEQPWFDISVLPDDLDEVDLLFVDGPVGALAHEARYPALPRLAGRLAPSALVILDDTPRPDEKSIVRQWSEQVHDGRSFEVIRRLDRAVVFAGTS